MLVKDWANDSWTVEEAFTDVLSRVTRDERVQSPLLKMRQGSWALPQHADFSPSPGCAQSRQRQLACRYGQRGPLHCLSFHWLLGV